MYLRALSRFEIYPWESARATARNKMQYEPVRIGEGSCGKEAAGKWAHVCASAYLKNDTSQFLSTRASYYIRFLFFDTAPGIRK
jgi:hypothetical protein